MTMTDPRATAKQKRRQGCQIFLDTMYQNRVKPTKNHQMSIKNAKLSLKIQIGHKIYNPKPSKIYPNWVFWFENMPSGIPECGRGPEREKRPVLKRVSKPMGKSRA
jgi:hypothetical protein